MSNEPTPFSMRALDAGLQVCTLRTLFSVHSTSVLSDPNVP